MKKPLLFVLILSLACCGRVFSQDKSTYEKRVYINTSGDTLLYRLLLPENYDRSKEYPMIVYLHGSGERGNDNEFQLHHGWQVFLADSIRKQYPAIVVFPQCPLNDTWYSKDYAAKKKASYFDAPKASKPTKSLLLVNELVDKLTTDESVDAKRLYIMGLSMGGYGTFESLERWPNKYAAAIPVCGGASLKNAKKYAKKVSVWIFHGADDTTVSPDFSRNIYAELKKRGCDVLYAEYPGVGHGSWKKAFIEPDFFPWLFSKQKK